MGIDFDPIPSLYNSSKYSFWMYDKDDQLTNKDCLPFSHIS